MNTAIITSRDHGSFFEMILRKGYEEGTITREKVEAILRDAPKGILQIAQKFEKPHLRSGLDKAMQRMVALVSLYLEYTTQGDVERALALLQQKSILELSRGGSELVKSLYPYITRSNAVDVESTQVKLYDLFARPIPTHSKGSLAKVYAVQRQELKEQHDADQFLKKIEKKYGNGEIFVEISGAYIFIVTGRRIESEQIEAVLKGEYDDRKWLAILDEFRAEFPELAEKYTPKYCMDFFHFVEDTVDAMEKREMAREDYALWENLWNHRTPRTSKRMITAAFTGAFSLNMSLKIGRSELLQILRDAHSQKTTLARVIEFANRFTPPEFNVATLVQTALDLAWRDMLSLEEPPKKIPKDIAAHFQLL